MSNDINRRDFMKVASATATTAGFTIAAGYSPFSYAQNSKVRVGCIGVGGQGTFHIREGLTHNPDIQIVAVADVYKPNQDAAVNLVRLSNAKQYLKVGDKPTQEQIEAAMATEAPTVSYDYKEVLANPNVDAVVIASPLGTHFEISMAALDAGKYVFCEKTLVKSVEDGRAMVTKCNDLKRWVQVGHQRRYNPKYNLAQWMTFDRGMLGRITHITSQWHRDVQWRRPVPKDYVLNDEEKKYITDLEKHLNWRLYDEISGGLYTELATHQTDISNWFLRAVPARVYSVGGLDYWRDGRTADDNIVMVYEYEIKRNSPGFIAVKPRTTLMDETSANKKYTVRFLYSSMLSCEKRGCCELIQGDQGSLELTEDVCKYYPETWVLAEKAAKAEAEAEKKKLEAAIAAGLPPPPPMTEAEKLAQKTSSGSSMKAFGDAVTKGMPLFGTCDDLDYTKFPSAIPDAFQFRAFTDCIRNGGVPLNNQMVGFTTAITALAAMESRKSGKPVEIDPASYAFDFEVPSFYGYDAKWGDKKCEQPKCECCGNTLPKPEANPPEKCTVCGQALPAGVKASPCPTTLAPPAAPEAGAAAAAPAAPAPVAAPAAPAAPPA
jgi:predicted dehydrogenase